MALEATSGEEAQAEFHDRTIVLRIARQCRARKRKGRSQFSSIKCRDEKRWRFYEILLGRSSFLNGCRKYPLLRPRSLFMMEHPQKRTKYQCYRKIHSPQRRAFRQKK